MTSVSNSTGLSGQDLRLMRACFLIAALWNFAGAVPAVIDPTGMFAREFGRVLSDPVQVAVYRGAWVTSLLYGLGFLAVARNPARHTGVVLMGGLGKALFAINLAYMHLNGWTSPFAVLVIIGDIAFVAAFTLYFLRLRRLGIPLL
ncbi:MAG: hypothetical protein QE285_10720 [Aquabacterium sp.]|nr:hypothetical protein [Aquabacterium sp.]